jgi:hypothetical protein
LPRLTIDALTRASAAAAIACPITIILETDRPNQKR